MIFSQIFKRILRSVKRRPTQTNILTLFSAEFLALSVVEGLVWISALLLFTSCSTSRNVQMQVSEHIQKDTIYLSNIQYDSIYIDNARYVDHSRDTIFIKEIQLQYKYKLLRDTVRIVQRDSIPYEVRITKVKEVTYIPPWCKWLSAIGGIAVLLLASYIFKIMK